MQTILVDVLKMKLVRNRPITCIFQQLICLDNVNIKIQIAISNVIYFNAQYHLLKQLKLMKSNSIIVFFRGEQPNVS